MPEAPPHCDLSTGQQQVLLDVVRQSIEAGLRTGQWLRVCAADYEAELRVPRATFVTLHGGGSLRGCIGTLIATRPLVEDVAHAAYAAAFNDPRFPPLHRDETDDVDLHVSILSPPAPLAFTDEASLLDQLRPGVDGLVLEDGPHRGTFLPSVWESLPDAAAFWQHLKLKAGLPVDHWSPTLRVGRYTCQSLHGPYRVRD
jgi:AmmeMemoRadiSam system protein A